MVRAPGNDFNGNQFLGVLESLPMATDDFFRARLDTMIDLRHPMAVLAVKMPWPEIEAALAPALAHRDRKGRLVEGADLFGTTVQLAGAGVSPAGRPRLPIRLMVSLPAVRVEAVRTRVAVQSDRFPAFKLARPLSLDDPEKTK